jgi:hypothetical protein
LLKRIVHFVKVIYKLKQIAILSKVASYQHFFFVNDLTTAAANAVVAENVVDGVFGAVWWVLG